MQPLCPFTSEGVKQKLAAVYALTDPELAVQANLVKTDFNAWMIDNFILDTTQQTYLNNLPNNAIGYLSGEISFCFLNRLPVVLLFEPPITGLDKWVRTENTTRISTNDNGDFAAEGTFIIKIVYE